MQVNSVSSIELIFENDFRQVIKPLNKDSSIGSGSILWPYTLRGCIETHGKPIAFIWHDSHLRKLTPKLIKWIEKEFKPLFKYDPLKWLASVGTCSPELRPYLKHQNQKET